MNKDQLVEGSAVAIVAFLGLWRSPEVKPFEVAPLNGGKRVLDIQVNAILDLWLTWSRILHLIHHTEYVEIVEILKLFFWNSDPQVTDTYVLAGSINNACNENNAFETQFSVGILHETFQS